MLTEIEARVIAMKNVAPGSKFVQSETYKNFYIFLIIGPDPVEGKLDPFFSVDKETGAFRDFSITDGGLELIRKFS